MKTSTAPVGPDFKPMSSAGSTFPAYGGASSQASMEPEKPAVPTIKKPESSSGMTVKLIHPDEDISLVSVLVAAGKAYITQTYR